MTNATDDSPEGRGAQDYASCHETHAPMTSQVEGSQPPTFQTTGRVPVPQTQSPQYTGGMPGFWHGASPIPSTPYRPAQLLRSGVPYHHQPTITAARTYRNDGERNSPLPKEPPEPTKKPVATPPLLYPYAEPQQHYGWSPVRTSMRGPSMFPISRGPMWRRIGRRREECGCEIEESDNGRAIQEPALRRSCGVQRWPQLEARVRESFSTVKTAVNDAKERFLDWIYPSTAAPEMPELPPCPPCDILCQCTPEPTRIYHVEDSVCDCGAPEARCGDCCGVVRRCPVCGQPYRRKISPCAMVSPCATFMCAKPSPKPQPLPELVVTSVGPFRDKAYVEPKCMLLPGSDCCRCVKGAAYECGRAVGSAIPCCRKPAPPAPHPGRPIRRMCPSFFPPLRAKRAKFPWSLCEKPPSYKPPRAGIVGAAEDLAVLGVGLTGCAVDAAADVLDQLIGVPDEVPGAGKRCTCPPPPLRYPKNGVYDDPPDPPTRATGWRLVDAMNNFLDALTFSPSKLEDVETIPEGELPETEKTGNPVVDKVNECLDQLLPPPRAIQPSDYKDRHPLAALRTYLFEKPRPLPPTAPTLLSCFIPDASGQSWVDKHLPDILFGEGVPESLSAGGAHVDYVNFNLVPSNVGRLPAGQGVGVGGPSRGTVIPVAY